MAEVFDVFISYRRRDGADIAKSLYDFLSGKGVRVFLDREKLEVGKAFPEQLRDAIKKAPHYVLIGTVGAFAFRDENTEIGDLDFVKEEIRTALANRSADRTVTVYIPEGDRLPPRGELSADVRDILDQDNLIGNDLPRAEAFEKILGVVTAVSRTNLWYGANRWLQNGKKSGGRFARLHIDESIMPGAERKKERVDLPIDVIADKEKGGAVPLLEAIKNTKGNLYLIGEGGIGKTTSLIRIMEDAYEKDYSGVEQIPIFVELSFAPDKSDKWIENRKSTFIFRSIYKQIIDRRTEDQGSARGIDELDEVFGMDPAVAVNPVRDLFTHESPAPEYLLLLDGLNEVSHAKIRGGGETVIGLVLQEIRYITEKCPNVRVILTSRSDESAVPFDGFTRIYLSGVDEENIENYLMKSGLAAERIAAVKENKELMKTLLVPLFLTMYADLKNAGGICTQGEILHAFFHERRDNIGDYTAQSRLARIGTNFSPSESSVEKARLSADMQIFILDHVLPRIGYEMERGDLFYVSPLRLYDPILEVINGNKLTNECGRYGRYVFPVICKDGTERSPKAVAKSIVEAFDGDEDGMCEAILDCLVKSLGLFQITNGEYGFIHQHLRDYFSAVKYINVMKLSAELYKNGAKTEALVLADAHFKDKPLSLQIRRFIGEITGEHHNKPYCENKTWKLPQNESLIMKVLDIYRDVDHKSAGYAVYSLIHILNEARGDLSGCDFSSLDFSGCSLNGMRLSRKDLPAKFDGAVLNYDRLDFLGHTDYIVTAVFSPDGRRIVTSSYDKTARIWDAEVFELICTLKGHSHRVLSASYSRDGKRILTASDDGTAKIWDAENFVLIKTLKERSFWVHSASYSHDGKRIISSSNNNITKIWDAESFELIDTIEGYSEKINSDSYSPDRKRIITMSDDQTIQIRDAENCELIGTIEGYTSRVNTALYSPDGKRIVAASSDKTVKIWDAESFELIKTLEGHSGQVFSASYSPDGKRIITVSNDKTVKIWDSDSFELIGTIKVHFTAINSAAYSPDGKHIVTASADKTVKIWSTNGFTLTGIIEIGSDEIRSASYSPDSKRIVTAYWDEAKARNAESFEPVGSFEGLFSNINRYSYSPDGKRIAAASRDGTIKIWDAERFVISGTLEGRSDFSGSVSYSPDGKRIVASFWEKVKIWDAESFKLIGIINGHPYRITSAFYSPDGKRIVTASIDRTAKIWDAESFELIDTLEGHTNIIKSAVFSPDGKRIVTSSDDKTAKIWDAESFEQIGTLNGLSSDEENFPEINVNSHSPDSKHIVTASSDEAAKIWDAETFECVDTIKNIPGLNFIGVDFTRLDPRSKISEEEKETIRRYGGII